MPALVRISQATQGAICGVDVQVMRLLVKITRYEQIEIFGKHK